MPAALWSVWYKSGRIMNARGSSFSLSLCHICCSFIWYDFLLFIRTVYGGYQTRIGHVLILLNRMNWFTIQLLFSVESIWENVILNPVRLLLVPNCIKHMKLSDFGIKFVWTRNIFRVSFNWLPMNNHFKPLAICNWKNIRVTHLSKLIWYYSFAPDFFLFKHFKMYLMSLQ